MIEGERERVCKEEEEENKKLSFVLSVLINHLVNGWWPLKCLALLLGDHSHELFSMVVPVPVVADQQYSLFFF